MINSCFNKQELIEKGVTTFHWFDYVDQTHILTEVMRHTLKEAPVHVGVASQYFNEANLSRRLAPRTISFIQELQTFLCSELQGFLKPRFVFNEIRIQQYRVPDEGNFIASGISKHRDRKQYRGIIVIIVVEDGGDFVVYNPESEKILGERGYVIVMRGAEFGNFGFDTRIRHAVECVRYQRTTIGLRFDATFSLRRLLRKMFFLE